MATTQTEGNQNKVKPKVLITRPSPFPELIEEFKKTFDVIVGDEDKFMDHSKLLEYLPQVDAICSHGKDKFTDLPTLTQYGPKLKIIAHHGAGYETLDVKSATQRSIYVTNTPDVVTTATSDITISLILSTSRKLSFFESYLRNGSWKSSLHNEYLGHDPKNKILGIIGMGKIGKSVALKAFFGLNMHIAYYNRSNSDCGMVEDSVTEQIETPYGVNMPVVKCKSLEVLLKMSDFISVNCTMNESSQFLLDKKQFEAMKDGVYIINTSRGKVIREEELVKALKSGKVRGAGLDVFENEPEVNKDLMQMMEGEQRSVTLLPHVGTATVESRRDMFELQLNNVKEFFSSGKPLTPVNKI